MVESRNISKNSWNDRQLCCSAFIEALFSLRRPGDQSRSDLAWCAWEVGLWQFFRQSLCFLWSYVCSRNVCRSVCQSVGQLVGRSVGRSFGRLSHRSVNRSVRARPRTGIVWTSGNSCMCACLCMHTFLHINLLSHMPTHLCQGVPECWPSSRPGRPIAQQLSHKDRSVGE